MENLRVRFPTDRKPYTCEYDYDGDSDLGDDSDKEEDFDEPVVSEPQAVTEKSPDDSDLAFIESSGAKSCESSDIVSVSDLGSVFSDSSDRKTETNPDSSAHVGKVIVIEDVAFVTYVALQSFRRIS